MSHHMNHSNKVCIKLEGTLLGRAVLHIVNGPVDGDTPDDMALI